MTRVQASPALRALAGRKGVDLDELARRLGRQNLAREDIENANRPAPLADSDLWDVDHAAHGPVTLEALPRPARVGARRLAAAQACIPAVTHHEEADIRAVEAFRTAVAEEARSRGVRLTALAFQVVALARGLQAFPRFNTSLTPDGNSLVRKHYCHVGIAVDSPGGLVVPVIRDADRKGLLAIAGELADLAARGRERKLRPHEMGGASMTLSNLGGIGGIGFTPMVNPPEVAILGISRSRVQPIWDGEVFRPVRVVPLDLTYDHRVISGAEAARFLAHHAALLAEPRRLLL